MGQVQPVQDVKLIVGVTFKDEKILLAIRETLIDRYGSIDIESPFFKFMFTDYYTAEMGISLQKVFWSFASLIPPEALIDAKLFTNEIETQYSVENKRIINIDPGYISHGNLVLATTKNFAHRAYLGKGIFGDVHMIFKHNQFHPMEWTYPDYSQSLATDFFMKVRDVYSLTCKGRK